jgi:hypothetical protein
MRKDYPEFDPNQARDASGKWTAGGGSGGGGGKYVMAGLAALGVLGGAGAALRYGPTVARYLRSAAVGKPNKSFLRGLREAARADARRAASGKTYQQGYQSARSFATRAPKAVGRDVNRARSYAQRLGARRRARFMERGHKKFDQLLKGYPEYRDSQARDDSGKWSEGGGGGNRGNSLTISVRGLESSALAAARANTPRKAKSAFKDSVDAYDAVRNLSDSDSAWRDPTLLDKAWKTYKNSVLSTLGITTLAGVSVVGGAAGGILGGAHVHPIHSAISAGLMSVAPNTTTFISYQAATRYLSLLFPREFKYAVSVARFMPLIAGGIALLGAGLATSLALRYAYRKYQSSGKYRGVSSFNTRLKELDNNISAINARMDTLTSMQKGLKPIGTSKVYSFKSVVGKAAAPQGIKCSDGLSLV